MRKLSLFDEPSVTVLGGALQWVPVRRRLGIAAFGTNAYRANQAGDVIVEEHVESPGQEEAYVVIRGRVRLTIGDEAVELGPGEVVFVPDPSLRRGGIALEDETALLAIGGWADRPYHSLPWEPIFLAQDAIDRGAWEEAVETLEREAGEHRGSPFVRFRLACCLAQAGQLAAAAEELAAAVEERPELGPRADQEALLAPLRDG